MEKQAISLTILIGEKVRYEIITFDKIAAIEIILQVFEKIGNSDDFKFEIEWMMKEMADTII